jgi:hypothetical protein
MNYKLQTKQPKKRANKQVYRIGQAKIILGQTQAKAEEGHENQDAFQLFAPKKGRLLLALADGAGGYGALNSRWAKALLSQLLTHEPMQNLATLDAWLDTWAGDFVEAQNEILAAREYLVKKFNQEGSAATLVAAWYAPKTKKLHIISYGDSFYAFFCGKNWHFPPQRAKIEQYLDSPYLLNWNVEKGAEAGFSYACFSVKKGARLWLSTDALGQLALSLHSLAAAPAAINTLLREQGQHYYRLQLLAAQNGYKWADFVAEWRGALLSPANFKAWIDGLRAKKWLEEDDYTAVYCGW